MKNANKKYLFKSEVYILNISNDCLSHPTGMVFFWEKSNNQIYLTVYKKYYVYKIIYLSMLYKLNF